MCSYTAYFWNAVYPPSVRTTSMRTALYKVLLAASRVVSFVSLNEQVHLPRERGSLWQSVPTYYTKMASNLSRIFFDTVPLNAKALKNNLKYSPHRSPGSKLAPDNAIVLGHAWLFALRCHDFSHRLCSSRGRHNLGLEVPKQ